MWYPSANGDVLTGQRLTVTKSYVAVSASSEYSILELRLFGLPRKSGATRVQKLNEDRGPQNNVDAIRIDVRRSFQHASGEPQLCHGA